MRERNKGCRFDGKRLLNTEEACRYVGMGRTKTRSWCEEIGAVKKFGARVVYDRVVIDRVLDQMATGG